ncbi:pentapeptide repeat-containing protein [Methylobacterium sp. WL120]|nr:pentapeptide repeat-containing protein [Methylobacterium sp. WL120]
MALAVPALQASHRQEGVRDRTRHGLQSRLSQACLSQACLSQACLSQACLSHACLSHARPRYTLRSRADPSTRWRSRPPRAPGPGRAR